MSIGEKVLYRFPSKGPRHQPQGNIGALGADGVFIGYSRFSNTFVISDSDGQLVHARSITRRPAQDRWDADMLAKVQAMPHAPRARNIGERTQLTEGATDKAPTAETALPPLPREMRITTEDLEEHGYDTNCPQCKHIIKWGRAKPGSKHSRECRTRLMQAMATTARGQEKLRANSERLDRSIADRIGAQDQQPASSDTVHGGKTAHVFFGARRSGARHI